MNYLFNNTHIQPKGKPIVYWIHKPSHTDIYADGYIGITSNTARTRWMEHLALTKNNRKNNKLYQTLSQEDSLIFDVIAIGETREYCEHIEHGLRPTPYIGWNTAPGGKDGYTQVGGKINQERWKQKNPNKNCMIWWRNELALMRQKAITLRRLNERIKRLELEPIKNHGKRKVNVRNKSGYTGVTWFTKYQLWRSQICIDKRVITLGYFNTPLEGHEAYLIAKGYVPLIRSSEMNARALRAIIRKPTGKN
jgi:hypothetical protein